MMRQKSIYFLVSHPQIDQYLLRSLPCPCDSPLDQLIDKVYTGIDNINYPSEENKRAYFSESAILARLNTDVDELNDAYID